MKLSLVVVTAGKMEGKELPITLSQFVIGRDPQCHLRPASPAISKRHCALLVKNGKVFVRDFESTNGTFVNEEQVKGEREIKHGDKLRVGPLAFQVKLEASAEQPARAATKPAAAAKPAATAKPPAKSEPATVKAAASSEEAVMAEKPTAKTANADEDIAAMLLAMGEDDVPGPSLGSGEVPAGSTVMDLALPTEGTTPDTKAKPDDKKKPAAKETTSEAADAILKQYMRRPR